MKTILNCITAMKKEENIVLPEHTEIDIEQNYIFVYTEAVVPIKMKMDKCDLFLMDYILLKLLSNQQSFKTDDFFKEQFNEHLKQFSMNYHRVTITRSINQLHELNLLFRIGRGRYSVNPEYYYRGDQKMRPMRIQELYKLQAEYKLKIDNHANRNNNNQ